MEVAGHFELDNGGDRGVAAQVGKVAAKWRDEASRHRLAKAKIEFMASGLEPESLRLASGG